MESEVLYLGTIHNPEGIRVGLEISSSLEHIQERMGNIKKTFGENHTFKIWECKPIK